MKKTEDLNCQDKSSPRQTFGEFLVAELLTAPEVDHVSGAGWYTQVTPTYSQSGPVYSQVIRP